MKTDDERRLLVLAKYHRDFVDFCRDHDLNPRGREVKWIDSPDNLRGYRDDWIVVLSEPSDKGYLASLIDIGQLILVEYDDRDPRPVVPTLPEITVKRGGIRFPWSVSGDGS